MSQAEFARVLGTSASMIKKLEEGKRTLSQDLSNRIFAETGQLLIPASQEIPLEYSEEDYKEWKKEIALDRKSAPVAARVVAKLIEVMLAASVRPGVDKSFVVFNALIQAIERVKNEFRMEKHIEAELRDRQKTSTQLYTVRELRQNNLLASKVEFKDDPKLNDDDKIPLTKTIGWMPTKDFFNIAWKHREFIQEYLRETLSSPHEELSTERKAEIEAKLAAIEKENDAELENFLPMKQLESFSK